MRHARTFDGLAMRQPDGYTFFFQIATDGEAAGLLRQGRGALDIHEASALFRQKWPVIEPGYGARRHEDRRLATVS